MAWYLTFAQCSELTASTLGLSFNLLLLYLIMTVNKGNMKRTNQILLQNCFIDMTLSVTIIFGGFYMVSTNGISYFVISGPFSYLGFDFASISFSFYTTCYVLSVEALPVPFYIRYMVLVKNRVPSLKNVITAYFLVFLVIVAHYNSIFWNWPPDAERYKKMIPNTEFWTKEFPDGGIFVARPTDLRMVAHLLCLIIMTSASYSLVIFFSIKITKHLKSHINGFRQTKLLNTQLHSILIIQAITPVITGNVPIIGMIAVILLGIEDNCMGAVLTSLIGWVAVVNPLAAMIVMTPYRKRIKELLRIKEKSQISAVHKQWCFSTTLSRNS